MSDRDVTLTTIRADLVELPALELRAESPPQLRAAIRLASGARPGWPARSRRLVLTAVPGATLAEQRGSSPSTVAVVREPSSLAPCSAPALTSALVAADHRTDPMTYYADLGSKTQIAAGEHIRAIGWLAADHEYPRGAIHAAAIAKLKAFAARWRASVDALSWPTAAGAHECELCSACETAGNFGVPAGDLLYVCPEMVAHYVEVHSYCPAPAFVEALLAAPLPGTAEYETAVAQFRADR